MLWRFKILVGAAGILAAGLAFPVFAQTPPASVPPVVSTMAAVSAAAQPQGVVPASAASPQAAGTVPASAPPDSSSADAAADPLQDAQMKISIQEAYESKTRLRPPEITPQEFGTVFFTLWQHSLVEEAKRGFMTRKPSAGEIANGGPAVPGERPRGVRELSLGGIVYREEKDWTIWLNGQRVTPDALPDQVLDLKVTDDHIDLKWFDSFTNMIFPVRLRAHQRFNLDARIFLPGKGM